MQPSNTVNNSMFLFYLGCICIALVVIATVGNALESQTRAIMNPIVSQAIHGPNATTSDDDMPSYAKAENYTNVKSIFFNGFTFLFFIGTLFAFYTSFVKANTLQGYVFSFISGIIVCAVIGFVFASLWNSLATMSVTLAYEMYPTWFIQNFAVILVLNLIAGAMSFVFSKGVQGS